MGEYLVNMDSQTRSQTKPVRAKRVTVSFGITVHCDVSSLQRLIELRQGALRRIFARSCLIADLDRATLLVRVCTGQIPLGGRVILSSAAPHRYLRNGQTPIPTEIRSESRVGKVAE
jgi:hypothetical protein